MSSVIRNNSYVGAFLCKDDRKSGEFQWHTMWTFNRINNWIVSIKVLSSNSSKGLHNTPMAHNLKYTELKYCKSKGSYKNQAIQRTNDRDSQINHQHYQKLFQSLQKSGYSKNHWLRLTNKSSTLSKAISESTNHQHYRKPFHSLQFCLNTYTIWWLVDRWHETVC